MQISGPHWSGAPESELQQSPGGLFYTWKGEPLPEDAAPGDKGSMKIQVLLHNMRITNHILSIEAVHTLSTYCMPTQLQVLTM